MRKGGWIQTFSGTKFWPLDPRAEDVHILDIAQSLALQARYTGHTWKPYSVAQHSYLVSKACPPELALWGLLHDAAEAYLGDVASPLKHNGHGPWVEFMDVFREAENKILAVVAHRFDLPWPIPEAVKRADLRVTATEWHELMGEHHVKAESIGDPIIFAAKIKPWDWYEARARFTKRFCELGGSMPSEERRDLTDTRMTAYVEGATAENTKPRFKPGDLVRSPMRDFSLVVDTVYWDAELGGWLVVIKGGKIGVHEQNFIHSYELSDWMPHDELFWSYWTKEANHDRED